MKIIGIYKITNTATGDFYIGSSKNVYARWRGHKSPAEQRRHMSKMYQAMQDYGLEVFKFEIIEECSKEELKEREQYYIELLQPTYNKIRAVGHDLEKRKRYVREYSKTDKCKKRQKEYDNQLCIYNGKEYTLHTLRTLFYRKGIIHSTIEARKYLITA